VRQFRTSPVRLRPQFHVEHSSWVMEQSISAKVTSSDPSANDSPSSRSVESLIRDNDELRRNSLYRSLFLSRLAHELRTPLTSILGFSEILITQEHLTDAQRSFCERIQSSAHQLQSSLNQLSDLSRLEAGQTELVRDEFPLTDLLRESVASVARRAEKKRVTIHSPEDKSVSVNTDRGRLRQVLYNVLGYAIQRSPEGASVDLDIERFDDRVEIKIRDRGEALSNPEQIGVLEAADDKSGIGELGLAIALQHIQILGGGLSANNRDEGLEMKVIVPVNPSQSTGD
jgi:signal transduction histidine kinase